MTVNKSRSFWLMMMGPALLVGCSESDRYREAAEVAREGADRQADQNKEMARLNREVAESTRRLVEADAENRREMLVVHQTLQRERATLHDRFDALEAERQQIAKQRRTESMFLPIAKGVGMMLTTVVVVGFCWTLLFGLRGSEATDSDLTDLLLHDLVREESGLLRRTTTQPVIENRPAADQSKLA